MTWDDEHYSDEADLCDHDEEDFDILTGRVTCFRCGNSRWLSSEEFQVRAKQEAEFYEAYYAAIGSEHPPREGNGNG